MSNPSKQKGTAHENEIVDLFKKYGITDAHRTEANKASHDIRIPGVNLVIESKHCKIWSIPAWVRKIRKVAPLDRWVIYASAGDRRTLEGKALGTVAVMDARFATQLIAEHLERAA
jgi:hypothetical protein